VTPKYCQTNRNSLALDTPASSLLAHWWRNGRFASTSHPIGGGDRGNRVRSLPVHAYLWGKGGQSDEEIIIIIALFGWGPIEGFYLTAGLRNAHTQQENLSGLGR